MAEVDPIAPNVCLWCEEPILEGEAQRSLADGKRLHYECLMRQIIGSVGHQKRRCSCYGFEGEGDPPGVSQREAARQALAYYEEQRSQAYAKAQNIAQSMAQRIGRN